MGQKCQWRQCQQEHESEWSQHQISTSECLVPPQQVPVASVPVEAQVRVPLLWAAFQITSVESELQSAK